MKFKRNVPAFVLALVLVFTLFAYVSVSNDNSELEAEVSQLSDALADAQDSAESWRQKYNDLAYPEPSPAVSISPELQERIDKALEQAAINDANNVDADAFFDDLHEQAQEFDQTVQPTPEPTPQPTPEPQTSVTVYITNTGEKYHRWGCQYLWNSSIAVALDYALASGYTPCSRCNPPRG